MDAFAKMISFQCDEAVAVDATLSVVSVAVLAAVLPTVFAVAHSEAWEWVGEQAVAVSAIFQL